jgi:hypothetical protein
MFWWIIAVAASHRIVAWNASMDCSSQFPVGGSGGLIRFIVSQRSIGQVANHRIIYRQCCLDSLSLLCILLPGLFIFTKQYVFVSCMCTPICLMKCLANATTGCTITFISKNSRPLMNITIILFGIYMECHMLNE